MMRFQIGETVTAILYGSSVTGTVVDYYYDAYENGNVWVVNVRDRGTLEFDDSQLERCS